MKFIGRAALALGFNQESLARELKRRTGRKFNGANVFRHFDADRPREKTLRMYAQVLRIPQEAIDILSGRGLTTTQKSYWWPLILTHVCQEGRHFVKGTGEQIRAALGRMNQAARDSVIETFALSVHSAQWVDVVEQLRANKWPEDMSLHILALAPFIPEINLRERLRVKRPNETALYSHWFQLCGPLSDSGLTDLEAQSIVDVHAAILRARGADVGPMVNYYRRESALRRLERKQQESKRELKRGIAPTRSGRKANPT